MGVIPKKINYEQHHDYFPLIWKKIKNESFLANKSCRIKKNIYLCNPKRNTPVFCKDWRGGRVVDCGGLENRWTETFRGFESLPLRKGVKLSAKRRAFFVQVRQELAPAKGLYKKEQTAVRLWVSPSLQWPLWQAEGNGRASIPPSPPKSPVSRKIYRTFFFCAFK